MILKWIIIGLSLLPIRVLYAITDFLRFLNTYIFKYRYKVVYQNLKQSFPEKSEQEIQTILKQFYVLFFELIAETIKLFNIKEQDLMKMIEFKNWDIFEKYQNSEKGIVLITAHYGNWEIGGQAITIASNRDLYAIFAPLKNKTINKAILKSRTKFGAKFIATKDVKNTIQLHHDQSVLWGFLADQAAHPDKGIWLDFLGNPVPVFRGPEVYASQYNMAVLFSWIERKSRGKYVIDFKEITQDVSQFKPKEITEIHNTILQDIIKSKPQDWLWSHKRWKHKAPVQWKNMN